MSTATAQRPTRAERSQAILAAAREVFCQHGFEAATVATIATRIGVVEGTVYKYFESKRALLLAVLEGWYQQLVADHARDLAGVTGTRARLRLLIWRHLRTVAESPRLCGLMFREVRGEHDYPGSRLHQLNREYTDLLLGVLREGVDAGEIRADIPLPLLRDMVFGGIEHYTWTFRRDGGELAVDATADHIHALLWDGIAADTGGLQQSTERLAQLVDRLENNLP